MAVNKVILIGHVGQDPLVKSFENNEVANFSLATTEKGYTAKTGAVIPDRTEWHNIVVWGGLTKIVRSYVHKGTQLYVEGKIRTRSYDDKTYNTKRYVTEIYADSIQLLSSAPQQQQTAQTRVPNPTTIFSDVQPQGDDNIPF